MPEPVTLILGGLALWRLLRGAPPAPPASADAIAQEGVIICDLIVDDTCRSADPWRP